MPDYGMAFRVAAAVCTARREGLMNRKTCDVRATAPVCVFAPHVERSACVVYL